MKEARLRTGVRLHETVSQARMADLVSAEIEWSIGQTQWGRYELGESEPPLDVIRAAAKVSELSPEYIAFGVVGGPDPALDRRLTDDGPDSDRARAERAAEATAKKRSKKRA